MKRRSATRSMGASIA